MCHLPKCPAQHSHYKHLLEFSNTKKEFQTIDSLCEKYNVNEIKKFLELKKKN